ncbi:carboxypeptidase-like regulatory domain-containing protein [Hymenobacter sp. 5317J-9]|uniref:carboxypeptidase-like regulatory domain-containing protein n=1 Tax=Hymenobacter sp. 5317J-9 TaxID=2932250 RepID=UPI001FD6C771|nr:carboxypeptidase-like regulatory domain-containing protein [Hymenobacter sp. 5317J-9]UOQ97884.1 carboxypeptidase-like regulatory domain-containing protein [Hymenobacter sp. 5317J-9]
MRLLLSFLAAFFFYTLSAPAAQARELTPDSSKVAPAPVKSRATAAAATKATSAATVTLIGKIMDGAQALPGAVVVLTGTNQMTVTNAAGEFTFDVPAHAGPLQATVTYAGYADAAVTLSPAFNGATIGVCKVRPAALAPTKSHLR